MKPNYICGVDNNHIEDVLADALLSIDNNDSQTAKRNNQFIKSIEEVNHGF